MLTSLGADTATSNATTCWRDQCRPRSSEVVGCLPLRTAAKSVSVTSPRNPSASAPPRPEPPPAARRLATGAEVLELLIGHGLAQVADRLLDAGEFADGDH